MEVELVVLGLTLFYSFLIFLLVGLKEACIPNFSFLGCLEVVDLWLEKKRKEKKNLGVIRGFPSLSPAKAEVYSESGVIYDEKVGQFVPLISLEFLITLPLI
jgi:hypothetical protein